MGWTSLYRAPGKTDREFFGRELDAVDIIESATINNVFYAAVRTSPQQVSALIIRMHRNPRSHDGHNFTYKAMHEDMGPVYTEAPARVLNALDPTNNEYALAWRAQCLRTNARLEEAAKVTRGDRVRFERPIAFADDTEHDTFTFITRSTFRGDNGRYYRLPHWRRGQRGAWERIPTEDLAHA